MTKPLWQPTLKQIAQSNMMHFMQAVNARYQLQMKRYTELYEWSLKYHDEFWAMVWEFCGIKASQYYQHVSVPAQKIYETQWFVGAKLNFAENLLSRRDEKIALIFCNERDDRRTLTYAALYKAVACLAAKLREVGVKRGDRIAAIMPNMPETVIAMLATTSIGAIWSSCSPDFGNQGILDRFEQIKPKILFAVDGQYFHGKHNNVLEKLPDIVAQLPSIEQVIVIPYVHQQPDITMISNTHHWQDFQLASNEIIFTPVDFNDPVYILYSSGTTGIPKCIVHAAGRVLIQHLKELMLHTDLKEDDVFFYFTTCGWMMWNWYISGLAIGTTLVLYDGSPTYPNDAILINVIDEEHISIFGTSAKYMSHLEKANACPRKTHRLTSLRCILSTGSPLTAENFTYVYRDIKTNVCLSSISGGTDIVSCFALGNPMLPVYSGELQCRGLGLAVEIFDEQGKSIRNEKGELVCTAPFPAMPIGFWNDPNNEKFLNAYFAKYDNVWTHGDYAELTDHDGIIIYGRSDAVLNPGGVRIGTAEIYRQVEKIDVVLESVVVGQPWKGDERIILFVRLRDGVTLDEDLKMQIKQSIRENASPRHVPAKIIQVNDIPRTISGKIVEIAVRDVIHGRPVKNREALANPEALDQFVDIPELKQG